MLHEQRAWLLALVTLLALAHLTPCGALGTGPVEGHGVMAALSNFSSNTQGIPTLKLNLSSGSVKFSALCAVAKNENLYVADWLSYHQCLGFDKVYLYDHNSDRPLALDVEEHILSGFVEVQTITGSHKKLGPNDGFADNLDRFSATIQGQAYKECLLRHGGKHAFMGFIDVDEFLVFHDPTLTSVNQLLKRYMSYGGVSFYWQLLGSSGHLSRPQRSVVESYTKCVPEGHKYNTQFKTFVNTAFGPTMYSPHRADFTNKNGSNFLVDEHKRPITKGRNKNSTHEVASIYHYAIKSRQDFEAKVRRGGGAGVTRPLSYFTSLDTQSNCTCHGAILTLHQTCS